MEINDLYSKFSILDKYIDEDHSLYIIEFLKDKSTAKAYLRTYSQFVTEFKCDMIPSTSTEGDKLKEYYTIFINNEKNRKVQKHNESKSTAPIKQTTVLKKFSHLYGFYSYLIKNYGDLLPGTFSNPLLGLSKDIKVEMVKDNKKIDSRHLTLSPSTVPGIKELDQILYYAYNEPDFNMYVALMLTITSPLTTGQIAKFFTWERLIIKDNKASLCIDEDKDKFVPIHAQVIEFIITELYGETYVKGTMHGHILTNSLGKPLSQRIMQNRLKVICDAVFNIKDGHWVEEKDRISYTFMNLRSFYIGLIKFRLEEEGSTKLDTELKKYTMIQTIVPQRYESISNSIKHYSKDDTALTLISFKHLTGDDN